MRKHLRQFMVAAGLGAAATAQAETPPDVQLLATPSMMQHLEPIKTSLLKLTGRNTVVISRHDIMTPEELARHRVTQSAGPSTNTGTSENAADKNLLLKMNQVLSTFSPYLPGGFVKPQNVTDIYTKAHVLLHWSKGYAGARPLAGDAEKKSAPVCIIVAPDPDQNARDHLRAISGLPTNMNASLRASASDDAFFQGTVLHEGAHCGQDLQTSGDSIRHAFFSLGYEIDADRKGLQAYRENNADQPQKAIDLQKDWHAARAIGTVRNSHNLTSQSPSEYHTHSTNLALAEHGAEIDPASIILAASSFKEANNLMIGFLYGIQSINLQDPNPIRDAGTRIARDNPYIEYATARTLLEAIDVVHANGTDLTKHPRFVLVERTAREYVDGFERLIPDAKTNPVVLDHQKYAAYLMNPKAIAKELLPNEADTAPKALFSEQDACAKITPKDQSAESALRAQEQLRFCRLKPPSLMP